MMNYANPYFNPQQQFTNLVNQYPQYFSPSVQQAVAPQQQMQQQPQQITTQPPIMQPQAVSSTSRIIPVSNREEATASPVDLINGTPSFFYNKEKNEVYIKQFDVPTGKGIFKTFVEVPMVEDTTHQEQQINPYEKELKYIREGVEGLYRILSQPQQQPVVVREVDDIEIETPKKEKRKNA